MPDLFKRPRNPVMPETYDEIFEHMQTDAVEFAEQMRAANARCEVGFEDVRPYQRYRPDRSSPVTYYDIRLTTKYGGSTSLAGRCHEWEEAGSGSSFFQTARHLSLELAAYQRQNAARLEPRTIGILTDTGKLAIATHHLHGNARQRDRVSTWDIAPEQILDNGLRNGLVEPRDVLRDWAKDLTRARDKYLRG